MLPLEQQNVLRQEYRAAHPGWRPATELYAELVRGQLGSEARLLDLGCGRGGLVEQLDYPPVKMVGIDPDIGSLATHRLPLPRAAAMSDHLPFADDSFDLVFASWLLEHLALPSLTFESVARVLRPGGVFVFITPNARNPLSALNRGLGRFADLQGWLVRRIYGRSSPDTFPTFYRANTASALVGIGRRYGLVLSELHFVRDPTYLAFTPWLFRMTGWLEDHLSEERSLHLVGLFRLE